MRIAVDATPWFNERGYGRFTREILAAAARLAPQHEFVYFVDSRDVDRLSPPGSNVTVQGVALAERLTDPTSPGGSRSLGDMLKLTSAVKKEKPFDALYYPTVHTYFPAPRGVRVLVTIHDALIERNPEQCLPTGKARMFWKLKVNHAIGRSTALLTVSDFARDEIARHLKTKGRTIHLANGAPASEFRPGATSDEVQAIKKRLDLEPDARYLTYVGGFNPHKNLEMLVRAHARVARDVESPPHLVLVGARTRDEYNSRVGAIENEVRSWGTENLVRWADYLPDAELRALHCGALAHLLPSDWEGFGLPAVEAAACGTPVIATLRSPLPRLLEGGGLFYEPGDEHLWTEGLGLLRDDSDQREAMAAQALKRAQALTWDGAGNNLLEALEAIAR